MPREISFTKAGARVRISCDTCLFADPSRTTRLPDQAAPIAVRIGDMAGHLDLCDRCREHATVGELLRALRLVIGEQTARWNARGARGAADDGVFDRHHAPCPLCEMRFRSPSGVWSHIERRHRLALTTRQKDEVWGMTCFFGCGFPIVSARSMSQHLGRAHPTVQGGQLFTGLAQAIEDGDPSGLARAIVKRITTVGSPPGKRARRAGDGRGPDAATVRAS